MYIYIYIYFLQYIRMVKPTEYKQRKTAINNGRRDHKNLSKERLLSTYDTIKHITENLSRNGVNKIAKIQNLSLDELEKIERMNNLLQNVLEQIATARHIKNYKDMPREDLLIALLKSNQSHTELVKINDSNTEIGETKKLFNNLRNNFSREEIKKRREKFYKKEPVYNYLKKRQFNNEKKKSVKKYRKVFQNAKRRLKQNKNISIQHYS